MKCEQLLPARLVPQWQVAYLLFGSVHRLDRLRQWNWLGAYSRALRPYFRPDGTGFRQLATKERYSLLACQSGRQTELVSPSMGSHARKYGTNIGLKTEHHQLSDLSVNFATGLDIVNETSGYSLKLSLQYVTNGTLDT